MRVLVLEKNDYVGGMSGYTGEGGIGKLLADPAKAVLDLVEFRDVPLGEAMRLLSQQSGLKIVASRMAWL